MKSLVLLSGGIDSTVLLHLKVRDLGKESVHALLCNYGQRHIKELDCAKEQCEILGVSWTIAEFHKIGRLFGKSMITGGSDNPVVPNRNAILLHVAAAMAVDLGCKTVAIGCNLDDQETFPDCRPEFLHSINRSLELAGIGVTVLAPFISQNKGQIIELGKQLGVDFAKTWSCYMGGETPCGTCDACTIRSKYL